MPVVAAAAIPVVVVIAAVFEVVVAPNTGPPPAAVPVAPRVTVPVHFAPLGQHAMFFELSNVQNVPAVQHAPASAFAKVEQEL